MHWPQQGGFIFGVNWGTSVSTYVPALRQGLSATVDLVAIWADVETDMFKFPTNEADTS